MISFKSFLKEQQTQIFDFDAGIEEIRSHCQPFISKAGGLPLFRGIANTRPGPVTRINNELSKITFSQHPSNRKPTDSSESFNFALNSIIYAGLGISGIRQRSIFVTGSAADARAYGSVMFCFPKGDIKWAWSPTITDAYGDERFIFQSLLSNVGSPHLAHSQINRVFSNLSSEYGGKSTDWVNDLDGESNQKTINALKGATPIALAAFGESEPFYVIKSAMKLTAVDLNYADSLNLPQAIESQSEIMIYDSEGYYLVPLASVIEHAEFNNALDHRFTAGMVSTRAAGASEYLMKLINDNV